jgi:hypothetical protein
LDSRRLRKGVNNRNKRTVLDLADQENSPKEKLNASKKSSSYMRSRRNAKTDFLNSIIVSAMVVNPTLSRKRLAVSKLCLIEVCEAVSSAARYIK